MTYTQYLHKSDVETFWVDAPCETNLEEGKKVLHDVISGWLSLLRPLIIDANLDDVEFYAYIGLCFACTTHTSGELSEKACSLTEGFRARIFGELELYYKNVRGQTQYADRIGKIMSLLSSFQEHGATFTKDLEFYRLMNWITEDSFAYRFNFRD